VVRVGAGSELCQLWGELAMLGCLNGEKAALGLEGKDLEAWERGDTVTLNHQWNLPFVSVNSEGGS
jgi:hypothetical protein